MIISSSVIFRMRNISDKDLVKIKTHILCSITFFRNSCLLCDNVEKYNTAGQTTDDNIIGLLRMRLACWITKATDTHTEHAILIAFPTAKMVSEKHLSITLCVHCLFCSHLNCYSTQGFFLIDDSRNYLKYCRRNILGNKIFTSIACINS